jgi:phage-related baseplate assembly protein
MSRFTPIDLAAYPVSDVLEVLSFEAYLARDRADLESRWNARRVTRPELPAYDTLFLESDPSSVILQVGSYRELILRARVNDALRSLTLAGASGLSLDHVGVTYYRTPRRIITPADGSVPAVLEDDETYRQRLALAPESWSTAGPVGAYVFWGLSASGDVLDIAPYSEDEGVCLAPRVRVVVLERAGVSAPARTQMLADVLTALRRADIRPLGDLVAVEAAVPLAFDLTVNLRVRSGVSSEIVRDQASARLGAFCRGRLRWAGEGETGPVWLIGRTFTVETLAGVAMGGDPNILDCDVLGGDINPPHAGYTEAALASVGLPSFAALSDTVTAHLFRAPQLGTLTINVSTAPIGWVG